MSCRESTRTGAQEPRIRIEPAKSAWSYGHDAALLIAEYGFTLDPWQEIVLGTLLAVDEDGTPTYLTVGLSVPRQNGKNAILEAYEFYKLVVCGESILHTAHLVKTVKKCSPHTRG